MVTFRIVETTDEPSPTLKQELFLKPAREGESIVWGNSSCIRIYNDSTPDEIIRITKEPIK